MSELTESAIKKLKVAELKAELTKRGLSVKGKKDELAKRLIEALEDDTGEEVEEGNDNDEEQEDEDAEADESQESLNESQESKDSTTENAENEAESAKPSEAEAPASEEEKKDGDFVMVEPPKSTEKKAVTKAAKAQEEAIEKMEEDQKDEKMEEDQPSEKKKKTPTKKKNEKSKTKTPVKDDAKKDEPMEEDAPQSGDKGKESSKEETTKTEVKEGEKTADKDKQEAPKKEEKAIEDKYVEVESEEGEDIDSVAVEDGQVGLESYTSDLNFVVGEKGLSGHTLSKNGFAYMWGGARANKGIKGGKVGYEVKILTKHEVDLPETEAPIHAIRIGWSTERASMQLGESSLSYGYESTGKLCASSSFVSYGQTFEAGDVIGTFLDLESEPKTLKYTKNGEDLGIAMSLTVNLEEKPLFPHILIRNMSFELNFGGKEEPWFAPLEGYTLIQSAGEDHITSTAYTQPESKEKCEVLMMIGLPNSGKTTWVKKFAESHSDKKYNLIGMSQILDRCKLEGKRRKKNDINQQTLMKNAVKMLGKLYQICPKKTRNYIYDQTNVYETAQKTKMEAFTDFKKKAILMVPTHDNLRKRTSDSKRKGESIHDIPFGDLCDMKCQFNVPEVGPVFEEILYPELDEKNAKKTVRDYQSDGSRAKRTGRDEFYPKKKGRDDHRGGRRDRYGGGNRRDDGWKSYGGGYSSGGYGGYNKGRSGGYKGRDQYQDPYRRNSGGSGGGYRNNSYSGGSGSYNKGSSYGSNTGYGSSNYGSSNYSQNSSYGNYGTSGNYNSYNSNQNYSQNTGSTNRSTSGGWGQYSSGNYNQGSSNQGGWSSGSGSGNWGGSNYNYNSSNYNYSGTGSNSYGGSGYSY